ncbi:Uncharacterised protein [Serratia plymuthica]|uniref:Uncharacterized protein n=1 Tax=Serratia plymuthica TaxID=82996 RepID=A0A2X4U600_SERPL|nr:Uncharacterised protein [Serratia plymuthica]
MSQVATFILFQGNALQAIDLYSGLFSSLRFSNCCITTRRRRAAANKTGFDRL